MYCIVLFRINTFSNPFVRLNSWVSFADDRSCISVCFLKAYLPESLALLLLLVPQLLLGLECGLSRIGSSLPNALRKTDFLSHSILYTLDLPTHYVTSAIPCELVSQFFEEIGVAATLGKNQELFKLICDTSRIHVVVQSTTIVLVIVVI